MVLTPAVMVQEAMRLRKAQEAAVASNPGLLDMMSPGLIGMALSFLAGLSALRCLSRWLEQGRWHFFGIYCLLASLVVLAVG